jgi:uncharacterized protein (UPF0332 family)
LFFYSIKKEYAASINRAYYACIQQVIHLLLLDFSNESDFKSYCDVHNPNKLGIHELYIDLIAKELRNIDKLEASDFFNTINKLKKLRRQADYESCSISDEQNDDAIGYCETVLAILELLN